MKWYNKKMKWNGMSILESIHNVLTLGESQRLKRLNKLKRQVRQLEKEEASQ